MNHYFLVYKFNNKQIFTWKMSYNRQVIPLFESQKMLNVLISTTHEFPIVCDIIEKILRIYLNNVISKFAFNLNFFRSFMNNMPLISVKELLNFKNPYSLLNYNIVKIPSYMDYFYLSPSPGYSGGSHTQLFTENHFKTNSFSVKTLINCKYCKLTRCDCEFYCRNSLHFLSSIIKCIEELQKKYKKINKNKVRCCIKIQRFYRNHR